MANGYFNSSLTGQQIENLLVALKRGLGIFKGDGNGNITTVSITTEVATTSTDGQIPTAKAAHDAISKKANSSDVYTKTETNKLIKGATPTDYETVKAGAKKGETAVQPGQIYTKEELNEKFDDVAEIFVAQYGTTTFEEIKAAIEAGKSAFAQYGDNSPLFPCTYKGNYNIEFTKINVESSAYSVAMQYKVSNSDVWETVTNALYASTSEIKQNEQRNPTSDAVYKALESRLPTPSKANMTLTSAGNGNVLWVDLPPTKYEERLFHVSSTTTLSQIKEALNQGRLPFITGSFNFGRCEYVFGGMEYSTPNRAIFYSIVRQNNNTVPDFELRLLFLGEDSKGMQVVTTENRTLVFSADLDRYVTKYTYEQHEEISTPEELIQYVIGEETETTDDSN